MQKIDLTQRLYNMAGKRVYKSNIRNLRTPPETEFNGWTYDYNGVSVDKRVPAPYMKITNRNPYQVKLNLTINENQISQIENFGVL